MPDLPTTTITVLDHRAIGTARRARRLESGKTLRDVATAMGISIPHLSQMERGVRKWTPDYVEAFDRNTELPPH